MIGKVIGLGAVGGLVGGLMFGAMMGMMGMFPMIGKMVGQPSAAAGLGVHMAISALVGACFAVLFAHWISSKGAGLAFGLLYGAVWWVLGPLTLMPLFLGMGWGVNWNAGAALGQMPSLMGHLIFGGVLGFTYALLAMRTGVCAECAVQKTDEFAT